MRHFRFQFLTVLAALALLCTTSFAQKAAEPKTEKAAKTTTTTTVKAKSERPQCEAMTKKGVQCKNKALVDSKYCGIHTKAMAKNAAADGATSGTVSTTSDTKVAKASVKKAEKSSDKPATTK